MAQTVLGAQLYTVRKTTQTAADLAKTFRRLRQMGYQAVQVSAIGPIETPELAKILRDEGMTCAVTHVSLDMMRDTQKCLDYHQAIGCQYTAVGGFFPSVEDAAEPRNWERFAADLSAVARTLGAKGLFVGYHNHSHEWTRVDHRRGIEILLEKVDPQVWFELDTYWVTHGGGDPAAWIDRIASTASSKASPSGGAASGGSTSGGSTSGGGGGGSRMPCIHVKDMLITADRKQKMGEVGEGNLNWPRILQAAKQANVRWYLVERDDGDLDPFDSLRISYDNLRAMGLQ
ncbi:MAG: sugar phosphate isomerase/epimerase [Phycisphaeraceae bacterium]|nr:sugar phosphate isomerase/epimerase [Phycisphaeraceae bacterium]